ncbi:PAS domain-containing hybrid sensor histidine kinase/response regulator [Variovorax sp. VNK109]|uniref:PAS domain-containing hybrid sensor histidine kinase/response regulator n=1 Tax=Variovorax sp. VNK109 TaxID=3400919 RepID=UPI003C0CD4C7
MNDSPDRFRALVEAVQDYGIFMLDPGGIVSSWNLGAQRIKGYSAEEVIGQHFSLFYPEESRLIRWPDEELKRAAQIGRYEEEGWRVRKDGSRFWASVLITALKTPQGELTGFGKVTRDLTERRLHEEAMRESEERFRLLVDGVRDYAIYMLDPSGIIQSWNRGAELIKGYRSEEVVGRHYGMFFRNEDIARGLPQQELTDALTLGRTEEEGWRLRKDGSAFWANIVMTPIHGPDGGLRGFAKVTRDMTERLRLRELEHSSQRMNEFLAMLAHELRNPLAPIRNAVSILQMEAAPSPSLRSSRDMIDRQLTHMTRLVDDLLDAGRLTSGKIRVRLDRISFSDVVARAAETVRPAMEARSHTFVLDMPEDEIQVNADATRLAQVLQNLLGNAAKFTPPGGHIELKAGVEGETLRVQVRDDGEGFAQKDAERLFELFAQGEEATTSREGGLGIGLALARSLVEMHGGTIRASSDGVGRGSVFSFELPGASMAGKVDASGMEQRALVVDDNRDSADSMSELLRLLGMRVSTAYDGESALVIAAREHPAVVFLDLNMPKMSGAQVLSRIRALPGCGRVFGVAVSGYGAEDEKAGRADFSGFDERTLKPLDLAWLQGLLVRNQFIAG